MKCLSVPDANCLKQVISARIYERETNEKLQHEGGAKQIICQERILGQATVGYRYFNNIYSNLEVGNGKFAYFH
jgi:hypothetical protein